MRYLSGVLVFLGVVGLACGQQHSGPYWSVGGYGNVLYPGTGHAPGAVAPAGTNFGRPAYGPRAGVATHPAHGRSVIVPYPVYYGGFGYDPVFVLPSSGRSISQLTPEQKDAVSHRGRAVRDLVRLLAE